MANMIVKGNVGEVRTNTYENTQFLSFSLAENHGYFDKQSDKWVDKGTLWHNCTLTFVNNPKRFAHYCELITKGAPVLVSGRLSIEPKEKHNDQGQMVKYLNEYIQVESVGLTLDRIQSVTYKPKQDIGGANDPELQQRGQPMPPNAQPQDAQQFVPSMPGGDMDPENPF